MKLFAMRQLRTQRELASRIEQIRSDARLRLNLGCGQHPIKGSVNIDLYSDHADQKLDVLDLASYANDSVDLIENHHLFEHLSYEDGRRGLHEWRRILKQGGRLILTCPNFSRVAALWTFQSLKLSLGIPVDRSYTERMVFGPQSNPGMFHRAGYDHISLRKLIESVGYRIEHIHTPYPIRPTPSMLVIAQKQ